MGYVLWPSQKKKDGGVGQEKIASGADAVSECIGGKSGSKGLGICS